VVGLLQVLDLALGLGEFIAEKLRYFYDCLELRLARRDVIRHILVFAKSGFNLSRFELVVECELLKPPNKSGHLMLGI